jgi:hypothetical protein
MADITQHGSLARDDNDTNVMGGTSSVDNQTIINSAFDPITRRLLTDAAAGTGTVSSFSFTDANGISGVVTNPTTTPNLTLSLGAITPSSITLPTFTSGSVIFAGVGGLFSEDNANFSFTSATKVLTLGSQASGGGLIVNSQLGAEQAPDFTAANWTITAGWEATNDGGTALDHYAAGVTTITPSAATTIVIGTTYKVVLTTNITVGTGFTYTVGGVAGTTTTVSGTTIDYIKALTTGKLIITPSVTTNRFTITAISIMPIVAGTGDAMVIGDIELGGRLRNPNQLTGLTMFPSGAAGFGGALSIVGALTGATTGAFSGAVTTVGLTSTVGAIAFASTDGIVNTNITASTAVAPIQRSPRYRNSATVFDSATRTVNFTNEVLPIFDPTTATARMLWSYGYNAVTPVVLTDRMSLGSEGTLDIFGTTLGTETMTNGALTAGTSWTRTGDMALAANAATYTHSTGLGTLSQAAVTLAVPAIANRWYVFTYTASATTTGVTAYIDTTFAQKRVYLNLVAGTYTVYFKTAAAPGAFTINCTSTAGAVTLDTFSLKEVQSGDITANGKFTGGGTNGLKIDGAGNAVFDGTIAGTLADATKNSIRLLDYTATAGGTADAMTLTPSPAITSYASAVGQEFIFIAVGTNTVSPPTVNISGLGALNTTMGSVAVPIGGLISGNTYRALIETATSIRIAPYDAASVNGDTFNGNIFVPNVIQGFRTTATAAGTTVLTANDAQQQFFTGATTQTVTLPVVTTLVNGFSYYVDNNSTGIVTVQTSGANTLLALPGGTAATFTVVNTAGGTGTASWNVENLVNTSSAQTLTNKRITKRVLALSANSATPAINTDNFDVVHITGQTTAITSFTTNLTGTPVDGDMLRISVTGTGAVALTLGASFEASGNVLLPTTTVGTTRLDIGFFWSTESTKWRCVATA